MLKKYVAVLLISFSAILMVGHDIIPHHHENDQDHHHVADHHAMNHHAVAHHSDAHSHNVHANQHKSDSKDSSNEKGGLSDLLSYFAHTVDFAVQEVSVKQTTDVENDRTDNVIIKFGVEITLGSKIVSIPIGYNYKGPGYIPPFSNSKGLRAPPVFFS